MSSIFSLFHVESVKNDNGAFIYRLVLNGDLVGNSIDLLDYEFPHLTQKLLDRVGVSYIKKVSRDYCHAQFETSVYFRPHGILTNPEYTEITVDSAFTSDRFERRDWNTPNFLDCLVQSRPIAIPQKFATLFLKLSREWAKDNTVSSSILFDDISSFLD